MHIIVQWISDSHTLLHCLYIQRGGAYKVKGWWINTIWDGFIQECIHSEYIYIYNIPQYLMDHVTTHCLHLNPIPIGMHLFPARNLTLDIHIHIYAFSRTLRYTVVATHTAISIHLEIKYIASLIVILFLF